MSEIFYPISFPTPINTNIAVSESFIGKTYAEMYTTNRIDSRLGFSHLFNLNGSSKISYSVASGYFIWFSAYDANGCYLGQSYALGWKQGSAEITFQPQVKQIAIFFRKGDNSVFVPNDWPNVQCKVSILCNYPNLSIITTPEGLEYAQGYNLLSVSKAVIQEIVRSGACSVSRVVSEGGIDVIVNSDTSGTAVSRFQSLNLPYGLTNYRLTFDMWAEIPSGGNSLICNVDICDANSKGFAVPTTETEFTSVHQPSNAYIFDNTYRGFVDFEIRASSGAMKAGTKIHIRHIMVSLSSDKFVYRPNPADLAGGGLPMSIIARGLPLTVRNSIDEAIQNSAAQLEQRLSTSIAQTGESIKNEVSQQYYAKGDTDKLIAEASTILEQKYNSFEMLFNDFKTQVNNNQDLTNDEFATITKFIRFIDGNIFLGEEGNNQMLKIAKDRISFLQGNKEVAYISDSTLYIYDGVFLNSLRIGNFAFVPRANGSLDFKKVR